MGNKEIQVATEELADCNGNIRALYEIWSGVATVSKSLISKSKGETAKRVKEATKATKQVKNSFALLLINTVTFFTDMGVSFEEADSAAAQNIDTLTN